MSELSRVDLSSIARVLSFCVREGIIDSEGMSPVPGVRGCRMFFWVNDVVTAVYCTRGFVLCEDCYGVRGYMYMGDWTKLFMPDYLIRKLG